MTDKEIKAAIESAIKNFSIGNLTDQAISLFKTLGYYLVKFESVGKDV